MTQAQIANIEAGYTNPTLRTLVKLAVVFEVQVSGLLQPLDFGFVGAWTSDVVAAGTVKASTVCAERPVEVGVVYGDLSIVRTDATVLENSGRVVRKVEQSAA